MKIMHMPGFTAEASLFNVKGRYQSTSKTPSYGQIVQPAADMFIDVNRPMWCLSALHCGIDRWGQPRCSNTGFGFWNRTTHKCDAFPNAWSN
jgi:hypothetical protein